MPARRAPRRWTEKDNVTLRAKHAENLSQGRIAKDMKRSEQTISVYAKKMGLKWTREPVIAATLAHVADAKARRIALELGLLKDAERLRSQIFAPHEYVDHGGKEYDEVRWTENELIPSDKLKIMQATTIALSHSMKLGEYDSDAGLEMAVGMLDKIAATISTAANDLDTLI